MVLAFVRRPTPVSTSGTYQADTRRSSCLPSRTPSSTRFVRPTMVVMGCRGWELRLTTSCYYRGAEWTRGSYQHRWPREAQGVLTGSFCPCTSRPHLPLGSSLTLLAAQHCRRHGDLQPHLDVHQVVHLALLSAVSG